eukprot:3233747-Pyramimonas_sp.AAC.1
MGPEISRRCRQLPQPLVVLKETVFNDRVLEGENKATCVHELCASHLLRDACMWGAFSVDSEAADATAEP